MNSIYRNRFKVYFTIFLILNCLNLRARIIFVGADKPYKTLKSALNNSKRGDTIKVSKGTYKEGNIVLDKPLILLGEKGAILDGENKFEIITISSDSITIKGFQIQNSGIASLEDPAAIKVLKGENVKIENNILLNNFFGIYLQNTSHSLIKDNLIQAAQNSEYNSGNGIHCWTSDNLQIIGNKVYGHRDGLYFEFVTNSVIWRNIAHDNLRYGLHFMFSHENAYITNYFKNNGAGVAVMFTKKVTMINNTFEENWGDSTYGALFKELTDCYLYRNTFIRNTTGILFDGSSRIVVENNTFQSNGWGMRIQANCMDNTIKDNNFIGNTFDVATNGTLILNSFNENYWDKYEGYDLDKDKIGDIPFHPLSLYSVIVEKNPPAMLLYRSFMITLLDKSEKIIPTLTPKNFVDNQPRMMPYNL
ncbi:MAG: nitrous oxide reductase family maturation protein NosD [Moheibacter sp.]